MRPILKNCQLQSAICWHFSWILWDLSRLYRMWRTIMHCKKEVMIFPSPSRDVTNQTALAWNRLRTGKSLTFFYSVPYWMRGIAGVTAQRIQGRSRLVLPDHGQATAAHRFFLSPLFHTVLNKHRTKPQRQGERLADISSHCWRQRHVFRIFAAQCLSAAESTLRLGCWNLEVH